MTSTELHQAARIIALYPKLSEEQLKQTFKLVGPEVERAVLNAIEMVTKEPSKCADERNKR